MRGVFVTGTGTGVGKTVVSAALALSRGAGYWKPVQTGSESDTNEVQKLASCEIHDRGVRLPDPVAPYLAAQRVGMRIDLEDVLGFAPQDGDWIVEGAGGVLVPLNEKDTMLDLIEQMALPVIVAARSTLGTINHTLLTLTALRSRNLSIERVVMVGDRNADNRAAIEFYGQVKVDELPWLEPLTTYTLSFHKL